DGLVFVESTRENEVMMEVVDVSGRVVYTASLFDSRKSIDMSHFQNGVYFIRLTQANQAYIVKVVLQK
ncbi:MAG: T9SS type A sorting domain-containing protein, partial [Flavobacteriales bacterium]